MPRKTENLSDKMNAIAFRSEAIERVPISRLKPSPRNARTHNEQQLTVLMASMREFGFINPVLVNEHGEIIAGHGRVEAARRLGISTVPVIRIEGLSETQIRAYRIADNRIAELAGWDYEILAIELQHIEEIEVDFPIEITGFTPIEVDVVAEKAQATDTKEKEDPADRVPLVQKQAVSRPGDLWLLGPKHRLLCGSALVPRNYERLLEGRAADFVCQDPPWNIAVKSISGAGRTQHREFVMASGEMSHVEFRQFLLDQLACNLAHARPGAVFQVFIDWRGVEKVIAAGSSLGLELINVCVWFKGHGSFGSPWRSSHELIVCFRNPGAPIKDRVKMGQHGRTRNNVWQVPGMGSFGKGRMEALAMHPTSKPVALLTEAIRDVTDRGDIVLDSFAGSGSCLIAAEKTGRIGYGMELDPLYVDTIVRRWQDYTGIEAVLEADGRGFPVIESERIDERDLEYPRLGPVRTRIRRDPSVTIERG